MKQTENFAQDAVLLMILTAMAVFTSYMPYVSILICGVLMLFVTLHSLEDEHRKLPQAIQLLLSAAFAAISGGVAPYLVFYLCRTKKSLQIVSPAAIYVLSDGISGRRTMPEILFGGLLLLISASAIAFAERLVLGYLTAKDQVAGAVSATAVNEMYEKKLNHELTVKNYLADRNARLEERENISRNIHNSVGHSITAAIMTLDAADMLFDSDPAKAREKMNTANERIHTSLASIRHAVRVLDDETGSVGVNDLIRELMDVIDSFTMDTTIRVRTDLSDIAPELLIPREHTEFLTGVMQELLTNGVRHGGADMFTVSLSADSRHVKLTVSDNGKSDFSSQNARGRIENGFGLKKLISYCERCGGSACFENKGGFDSAITLPLYKE